MFSRQAHINTHIIYTHTHITQTSLPEAGLVAIGPGPGPGAGPSSGAAAGGASLDVPDNPYER